MGYSSHVSKKGNQQIQITTIDNYVLENNLTVGLIKLDIEGYELSALIGAKNTIRKFTPVILISIYHNGKEFFETIDYIKKINPNYTFIIRHLNPLTEFIETCLIGWQKEKI